jgi:hypothetical protein
VAGIGGDTVRMAVVVLLLFEQVLVRLGVFHTGV